MELQSSQTQYNPFGYILQNHQGIHKKNERGIALLSGSLLRQQEVAVSDREEQVNRRSEPS